MGQEKGRRCDEKEEKVAGKTLDVALIFVDKKEIEKISDDGTVLK